MYAARHRVDQQVYAVKKTVLKLPAGLSLNANEEIHRTLQEARLFAALNNPRVLRYNHSWVEVESCPVEIAKTGQVEADLSVELESPYVEFASGCGEEEREESPKRSERRLVKLRLFIQMELCKETLEEYLDRRVTSNEEENYAEALCIARQLVQAMHTIHTEHGIIHRDLSLRNIFVAADNSVKVGDFGLATKCAHLVPVMSSPLEETSDTEERGGNSKLTRGLGTKAFAAPEQMASSSYDQKVDIYSLGLIFLVLFWPTETLSERYTMLRLCREQGPAKEFAQKHPEIAALIKAMTSADPASRPDIEELMALPMFQLNFNSEINERVKERLDNREVKVKLGEKGKCKIRYVRIIGDNLLLYNEKADSKAKLCYNLKECTAKIEFKAARKARKGRKLSRGGRNSCKITVSHPQLKTLEISTGEEHESLQK